MLLENLLKNNVKILAERNKIVINFPHDEFKPLPRIVIIETKNESDTVFYLSQIIQEILKDNVFPNLVKIYDRDNLVIEYIGKEIVIEKSLMRFGKIKRNEAFRLQGKTYLGHPPGNAKFLIHHSQKQAVFYEIQD